MKKQDRSTLKYKVRLKCVYTPFQTASDVDRKHSTLGRIVLYSWPTGEAQFLYIDSIAVA
jgi:hypothetical protein